MLEEKYKTWINLTFFFLTLRLSQHKRSVYKRCLYWMQTFSEVITFFLLKSPVWEMPVSYQEQHILEIVHTCIFSEVSYTVWHSNPLCWHSLQNYFSSEKTVLRFWGDEKESQSYCYKIKGPLGFSDGASGKEPICQCRRHERCSFSPWVGKFPWRRK